MIQREKKPHRFELVLLILGSLLLLFVIVPLINIYSHCSVTNIVTTIGERAVQESILLTLVTAMGATFLSSFFAIPLAYLLARDKIPLKELVNGIITIPIVLPHSAAGIALLGVVSEGSLIGKVADQVGIHFVGGSAGIMVAMAYVSLPFLIISARDGFMAVPERLEKVALNLGASHCRLFFTISLPLAWKSIVSGFVLMWARGMSEFGAVLILTYHPMTTPVMIFERFGAFGLKYARPVSVIFITISLAVFLVFRFLLKVDHGSSHS